MPRVRFRGYLALLKPWFRRVALSRMAETTSQLSKLSVYLHAHMENLEYIYGAAIAPPPPTHPMRIAYAHFREGGNEELRCARALAVAFAQLGGPHSLAMHLARAAAGPEILIQHDADFGLNDIVAHPLPARDVLIDARIGWRTFDRPSLLHEVPDLLGRPLAEDAAGVAERVDRRWCWICAGAGTTTRSKPVYWSCEERVVALLAQHGVDPGSASMRPCEALPSCCSRNTEMASGSSTAVSERGVGASRGSKDGKQFQLATPGVVGRGKIKTQ